MDELTPEEYMAITSNVLGDYDRPIYQSGYIDGLQTAIRILAESDEAMSYSVKMEDIFPDDDEEEEVAQEYDEITD
jgi:hypothetical protein